MVTYLAEGDSLKSNDHYEQLNSQLARGGMAEDPVAWNYIRLRTRVIRYFKLLDLDAPETIISNERLLIEQALMLIDPLWNQDDS